MGCGVVSPRLRVGPAMSLLPLFPFGATASLRLVSSMSPTLVQQHKPSDTANGVGAEVLDYMGPRADESVSGVGRKWGKGSECGQGQEGGEGRK